MNGTRLAGERSQSPPGRHLRGFVQLVAGQLLARAMTFVVIAYLARALGIAMFGAVGFAAAVAAYFALVVDAGLDLIGMREISRRELPVPSVVSSIVTMRLGLTALAAVLLWAAAPWIAPSPAVRAIIVAFSLTFLSFTVNLKWTFQALERNDLVSVATVVSQASYLAAVFVAIKGPADAFKVPLLLFGSEALGASILFACYRRQGFGLWLPSFGQGSWALFKEAIPLAGVRMVRTLVVNFDLIVLGFVSTPLALGLYTAVSRVILLLREMGAMYYLPLFPGLVRAVEDGADDLAPVGRAGLRYAAVIILPIAVGGCLTAPRLLSVAFGREYEGAAVALSILLVAMVFSMLTGTYQNTLVACRRQGTLLRIVGIAGVLSIGLNLGLIPRYSIVGAAVSALVSEGVLFFLAWQAVARTVSLSPWPSVVRPALAAAGMGVVLSVLPSWPLPVSLGIGVISYAVFSVWVGAVRTQDVMEAWHGRPLPASPPAPQQARVEL